jgi:acyl-CoA thioesterase
MNDRSYMLRSARHEHMKVPDAAGEIRADRRALARVGRAADADTALRSGIVRPCMTDDANEDDAGGRPAEADDTGGRRAEADNAAGRGSEPDDAGSGGSEVDDEVRERIRGDAYCDTLGIDLAVLEPGYAVTELAVTEDHLNFHGTPHGGAVYSVADAAFAAASNSRGDPAVALETNVSYLNAVDVGDVLTATAEETHVGGSTAEYEVVVTSDGERIATFRGRVYRLEA